MADSSTLYEYSPYSKIGSCRANILSISEDYSRDLTDELLVG
jgi:hypothetical protein